MSNLAEKLPESRIIEFLESNDECVVDLVMLIEIGVYTRKDTAVKALRRTFEEGIDYSETKRKASTTGISAVTVDDYLLTSDCFKEMCLMAETETGRLVRRYYLEVEKRWKKSKQQPVSKVKETIEGAKVLTEYLTDLGIEKTIAQSMSLDAIAQSHPELKAMCEPAKKLLSTDTVHESVGLTPTQIGKRLNPVKKPIEVNEVLESLGFQFKQPKRKGGKDSYVWQLTEAGKQHGFVYFATNKTEWSGDQIRWQDSVVGVIQGYLEEAA